jgi:hypothetical protein
MGLTTLTQSQILAQSYPSAGSLTDAYTVASSTVHIGAVLVCNQGSSAGTFRIAVAVAGAADTPAQYFYYDLPLSAPNSFEATVGVTLGSADVVRVYSSNGQMSFQILGARVG